MPRKADLCIRCAGEDDAAAWCALRTALWPDALREKHAADIAAMLAAMAAGDKSSALLAFCDATPCGLIELSLRHDYVNGCETSPVAFVEGLFVADAFRRRGIAAALIAAAVDWARVQGCRELASDAALDNITSHRVHLAAGFEETERVVYFRRKV
ncbi:hypothetical protein BJF93_12020 [Xaviernesmea oryzae]|uniref:Aminoglycoside N(6')-acetyltransferase type 1 n=1 Tax=Xaviernesmea oryzae TaxID=464029 RepID=A0A1Q9AVF8_9HYPH|nr:aminoglycoside 6'-N-acetyltransferase [Xaviernesmea oryzae]OLP59437.1 hypothetical protein BJF93_12020 [Xaviernesmea oryzae]SEL60102.1 aminoglycoside 6'-N-acetyltransferase I [Xaviernesmea oryzae]